MWKRIVNVSIRSEDGASKFQFNKHRIDFEYNSTIGWAGDYGTITIYNLSNEEIQSLQSRKNGYLNIQLDAFYGDATGLSEYANPNDDYNEALITIDSDNPLSTIFVGSITNVVAYHEMPESVTHLYCVPTQVINATKITTDISPIINKGDRVNDAFSKIAEAYGFVVKFYGVDVDILHTQFKRGKVFHTDLNDALNQLCGMLQLTYSIVIFH